MAYVNIAGYQGYIIDVAYALFDRADGKSFLMQNGSSTSTASTLDNVTISNGWLVSPQIIIDTTRTYTFTYTSNMTDVMLIAGVNNLTLNQGAVTVRDGGYFTAETVTGTPANVQFVIPVAASDLYIDGLEQAETLAAGKYTVASADGQTTVTMLAADVPAGSEVAVIYTTTSAETASNMDFNGNTPSATGRLTLKWPLYTSQDEGAGINAYIYQTFPKVKVTQVPGFDNSYKSEGSASIEFTSLSQRSVNAKNWSISIVPVA